MLSTTLNLCLTCTIWSSVMHMTYIISLPIHAFICSIIGYVPSLLLLNICGIFFKQSISVLFLSTLYSSLLQQPNFLTGIIKVWSYLIKFLFICCGKCESSVGAQSCAMRRSQKLAASFHSFCRLLIILSRPLVSVIGEWIAVKRVILHGACINDAEKLKS